MCEENILFVIYLLTVLYFSGLLKMKSLKCSRNVVSAMNSNSLFWIHTQKGKTAFLNFITNRAKLFRICNGHECDNYSSKSWVYTLNLCIWIHNLHLHNLVQNCPKICRKASISFSLKKKKNTKISSQNNGSKMGFF